MTVGVDNTVTHAKGGWSGQWHPLESSLSKGLAVSPFGTLSPGSFRKRVRMTHSSCLDPAFDVCLVLPLSDTCALLQPSDPFTQKLLVNFSLP